MTLETASISQKGFRTGINQDALLVNVPGGVFAVADGVGGSEGSEAASRLAIACLERVFSPDARAPVRLMEERLQWAFALGNRAIYRAGLRARRKMGTTLTVAVVRDQVCYVAHLGDSRAYLVAGGAVRLLTRDNRLVAEMVRNGLLTESAAGSHPHRNVLTGCLGFQRQCTAQLGSCPWSRNAKLVLCTDGITDGVPSAEIAQRLLVEDPATMVESLLALALSRGSTDDLTVVAVKAV
jgi:PPM family protein phosphatase